MIQINKSHWLKFLVVFVFAFLGMLLFGNKTWALSGANTFFPDTSPAGQAPSYSLVQVTGTNVKNSKGNFNADTKMKARTMIANIYVPKSMVGQAVSLTIKNGCDWTTRDNDSGYGYTYFRVTDDNASLAAAFSDTDPGCVGNDIAMSFVATVPNMTGQLNYYNQFYDAGVDYYVYHFLADGNMAESGSTHRYLNAFSIATNTGGTLLGISDQPMHCDKLNYSVSCPTQRTINGVTDSYVYSTFYGPWNVQPYSQTIRIQASCAAVGSISYYDLDANDPTLTQGGLQIVLRQGNSPDPSGDPAVPVKMLDGNNYYSLPEAAIENWGPGIGGLMNPHPGFGGNNDEYLDLPGTDPTFTGLSNFPAYSPYTISIEGLDSDNALQILPTFTHCQSTPNPTCNVTIDNAGAIHPGDRITFTAHVTNGGKYALGVNGPGADGQGVYNNYLTNGTGLAIRGSPVGVGGGPDSAMIIGSDSLTDKPYDDVTSTPYSGSTAVGGQSVMNIYAKSGGNIGGANLAPGSYPFQWGLVEPNIGWAGIVCTGPDIVVAYPPVTIQGTVSDADDINVHYPNVKIDPACIGGRIAQSQGDGQFTVTLDQGTDFCLQLDPATLPAHTVAIYVRPYWIGYRSCPGFVGNASPNNCTSEAGGYYNQKAGVDAGNGWDRAVDWGYDFSLVIADTAACSSMTITNLPGQAYPNNQYRVSMTFVNTGGKTWIPGQWNAGYHSWQWPNQNTNNYLSNGKPSSDPNYDTRIPQTTPGAVAPGGTASFYQDITVPPWWTGTNYPLEYRMVRDVGPPSGAGGYWMWSPNSTTCATTIGVGQGTLFDTFQTTKKESGTVAFCNSGGSTHSGTSGGNLGVYSFAVPVNGSFCAGVASMDLGAPGRTDVYPYSEGYNTFYSGYRFCAPNAACLKISQYDNQVMSAATGGWDRASNTGYDLGVSSSPIINCSSLGFAGSYGVGDTYTGPAAVNSKAATIFTAPAVNGTVSASLSPSTGLSTNYTSAVIAGLVPGGAANPVMSGVTFGVAGVYTFDGNFAWSGSGYGPTTAGCPGGTVKATESPYLRVYGGEVTAGVSYVKPCTTPIAADINAFAKKNSAGYWIGAGSQYGAFSNGSISGFLTATLSSPSNPTILAFSNSTVNLTPTPPLVGGDFGGLYCADEYWPQTLPTSTITTIDAAKGALGGKYLLTGGILSQTGPITKSMTIYVNGDVTITSDLTTGTSWASPDAIPSLYVIAKGNIHIANNVHNLDGLYVAEPTSLTPSVTGGRIWTCYNTNDADTIANSGLWIASNCASKLTINGALIAAKVNFLRTLGSVRNATVVDNNPVPSCSGVTLYGDISFFGPSANLGMGSYGTMPAAIGSGLSSAYVPAGCEVILHDAAGLGGATKTLHGDWSVFSGADAWNDKTRSIEVKAISADLHQIGLVWSYNGLNAPLIIHDDCVLFNVPTDVYWTGANANKYLCVSKGSAPGLEFRIDGVTPAGKTCVNINEADTNGWDTGKTLLCWTSSANLGLAWTWSGGNTGIPGMECTAVYDLNETHTSIGFAGWVDNYLCEPRKTTVIDLGVSGEPASSANIAEVIQFAPELLLSTPAINQSNTSNNLNSIIGLQPSL